MTTFHDDIRDTLLAFISSELLNDRQELALGPGDDLLAGGLVDSLGVMRLVDFIERRFEMKVPPEDVTIQHFGTVGCMEAYIRGREA